jgi:hypothetical protein
VGYFLFYVPFSALTKALSEGKFGVKLDGFQILPISVLASFIVMMVFLAATGWWRHSRPLPSIWTTLSGLCASAIIITTTLSYTFKGVSIVFVMLLMRGGVLCLAPVVDLVSKRKVRWFSWIGFGLSLLALLVAFSESSGYSINLACAICVGVYLLSYFIRLRFMSRLAKTDVGNANLRFFVEEQWASTPGAFLGLLIYGCFGQSQVATDIWIGITSLWSSPQLGYVILVGVLSQGIGIFGGLLLLDKSENTFCVPINRSSSILAGVVASYGLTFIYHSRAPSPANLAGAALIIIAILFLTVPPQLEKRRLRMIHAHKLHLS